MRLANESRRVSAQGGLTPTIGERIELLQAGIAGITNPIQLPCKNDLSVAYRTLHTSFNGLGRYGWVTIHPKLSEGDIHQTCRSNVPSNEYLISLAVASFSPPLRDG